MKVGQIPEFLAHMTPQSPVPILMGTTGIGKTMAVKEAARRMGRKMAAIPPLSTMLPEDANGVPIPQQDTIKFMPPDFWNVGENTLMFLDEFNLASHDVMSTLCSVLWPLADGTRRIGSLVLPEDLIVVAAAMPPAPGSPSRPLPDFLRSRFRIIQVEADANDWIPWAITHNIEPSIIAFIKHRPDLLAPPPPPNSTTYSFPTPRGWERLSYVIQNEHLPDWALNETAAGIVGEGAAGEFITYRTNMDLLPDPIAVLKGDVPFPKRADVAVATAVSVVQSVLADKDLVPYFFQNSVNWPADYVVGLQFPAIRRAIDAMGDGGVSLGVDIATVTVKYPQWLQKFRSVIIQIAQDD